MTNEEYLELMKGAEENSLLDDIKKLKEYVNLNYSYDNKQAPLAELDKMYDRIKREGI